MSIKSYEGEGLYFLFRIDRVNLNAGELVVVLVHFQGADEVRVRNLVPESGRFFKDGALSLENEHVPSDAVSLLGLLHENSSGLLVLLEEAD